MTVEELRLYVKLDKDTGELIWLPRDIPQWDTRYAGKPALTHYGKGGRLTGMIKGKRHIRSRVLWALIKGEWPKNNLDHINNNPSEDTLENLRDCTQQENMFNRKPSLGKSSPYKGVAWHKHSNKWRAYIEKDGVKRYLGYFKCPTKAALVYDKAAKNLFGEFAYLNLLEK